MYAFDENGPILCTTEAALTEAAAYIDNMDKWRTEQQRRIDEHVRIRKACKTCKGLCPAYGCDACNIAMARVGMVGHVP